MTSAGARLEELRAAGLHRRMRVIAGSQGARVDLDGREALLLCSNNYLGLADHPAVRAAGARAYEELGAGAGASRLVSGNMEIHERLERRLADFHGTESALLFGSGYLANTGIVAALARRGTVVYSDELNHASLIDGCRLAGARCTVYGHRDVEHLAFEIARSEEPASLIVTDGLFSMDGDEAPLGWLYELARNNGARLMVDDAHAVGAIGPGGRGTVAAAGLGGAVDVVVSTLGKSLGGYGAYACLGAELRDVLVNTARPMIFSTGLPPAVAAAAEAALGILEAEPERVETLRSNAGLLRDELAAHGLDTSPSASQIVPVRVGEPERAVAACHRLLDSGVFAQAIRPPTVPSGTSRLRLTAMATHDPAELRDAARAVAEAVHAVSADGEWSIDLPEPPRRSPAMEGVAAEVARAEAGAAAAVIRPGEPESREADPEPTLAGEA